MLSYGVKLPSVHQLRVYYVNPFSFPGLSPLKNGQKGKKACELG